MKPGKWFSSPSYRFLALGLGAFLLFLAGCVSPIPDPTGAASRPFSLTPTPSNPPTTTSTPPSAGPAGQRPSPIPLVEGEYYLRSPDPQILLNALNAAIQLEQDAWQQFDYGNFTGDYLTSPEARALFAFIQTDLERYYLDGFPDAGEVITGNHLNREIWFPPTAVWTLLQAGVVELLDQAQIPLKEGETVNVPAFDVRAAPVEFDGDPGREWLLEVDSLEYNLRGWLPVDEGEGGYRLIPNDLAHENQARAQGVTVQIIPDLNGDGQDDVVMIFDGAVLGSQFGYLRAYGWVGDGLYLLDEFQIKPGETLDIGDHDGDGFTKIRHVIPRTLNFDCEWEQINDYRWQGIRAEYAVQQAAPPDTPFCAAAQALAPLTSSPPASRAGLLESALAQISPAQDSLADYIALLHIHLAMAYAAEGLDEQAAQTLADAVQLPDGPFVELLRTHYDTNSSPLPLCYALFDTARRGEPENTNLAPYLTSTAMFRAYGNAQKSYTPLICPLQLLIESRLDTLQILVADNPMETLLEMGFRVVQPQARNIDGDPDGEWVGLLELEQPQVLLLDTVDDNWRIYRPITLPAPVNRFQLRAADLTGDARPEIILLATLDETTPVSAFPECWAAGASAVSQLVVATRTDVGYQLIRGATLCGEPSTLADLPVDEILALFPEEGQILPTLDRADAFYNYLTALEKRVLTGADPDAARAEIDTLIKTIPPDHPDGPGVIQRLLYVRGLSFEFGGEDELAVEVYLALIEQFPESPWSWLAWARLAKSA